MPDDEAADADGPTDGESQPRAGETRPVAPPDTDDPGLRLDISG